MTSDDIKKRYITNPCETAATAYWKISANPVPDNIQIIHQRDYSTRNPSLLHDDLYFRLVHDLESVQLVEIIKEYNIQRIDTATQLNLVVDILNRCYSMSMPLNEVERWTNLPVFSADLWILISESSTQKPIALGIADFDLEIREGSLEWIQVLPEYRGRGFGTVLVNELLNRLKGKANFVTVSGQCDNKTKPEELYRKCGFTGNDIWHVLHN